MPRRPNYRGDRIERDRAKATRRAAREEAKAARTLARKQAKGELAEPSQPVEPPKEG